jgi:DNA polymerase I
MLMKLFNYILYENNKDALAMVRTTIGKVLRGDVPASELVISRTCKGLDAYENPERQANIQTAKKLIAMGYEFIPGMKVSWIVTDSSKTPQVVEPYISGKEFTARPDYKYYAERLSQTASRITEVFGWTEKDLMSGLQQATLFDGWFDDGDDDKPDLPKPKPKAHNAKLSDFF